MSEYLNDKDAEETSNARGIGGGMLVAGWVMALGLITLLFNGWFDRQYNPNTDPVVETVGGSQAQVRLDANRAGHYVASGTINEVPAVFLVDTGATALAIPGDLAADYKLIPGAKITMHTANGPAVGYVTTLDRVQIGNIVQRNIEAVIAPTFTGNEILLGMSFLKHLDIEQTARQLTLRTR